MNIKKFSEMTKREKTMLIAGGVIFAIFFIYFIVIETINGYMSDLDEQIKKAKERRDEISMKLSLLKRFARYNNEYKKLSLSLKDYVFTGSLNKTLDFIKRIFKDNNIEAEIRHTVKKYSSLNEFTFTTRFKARYKNLIKILYEIEYSKNVMVIKRMNVNIAEENNLDVYMQIIIPANLTREREREVRLE